MALFSNFDDKPKKPSFFQRVRQAVTGAPAPSEEVSASPDTAPSAPAQAALLDARDRASLSAQTPVEPLAPQSFPPEVHVEPEVHHGFPPAPDRASEIAALEISEVSTPEVASQVVAEPNRTGPPPAGDGRNEFGLRPMANASFSFGGYTAEDYDDGFVDRMRTAVSRSAEQLNSSLNQVLALGRSVDETVLEELEAVLLTADIGMTTTQEILDNLRSRALRENATTEDLRAMLRDELRSILNEVEQPTNHPLTGPEVIMMVGVNGTGKTTTSGKLAALYGTHGRKALLCAADTFRAAAIEQLDVWAQRSGVDIIKTKQGGDPAAALYDALAAGKARGADIVIVDTAGRLHNKAGLMAELDKMRRTATKLVPGAPHQTFLVLDATTGQNGMQQARLFTDSAGVTGIVLTKLDGTAKGGIVVAIARELKLPVVFVGTGEKMSDIVPFDADTFVDSLLSV